MNRKAVFLLLTVCCAIVLAFSACTNDMPTETEASTTPENNAEVMYENACSKLSAAPNLIISYDYNGQRQVNGDTYTTHITGTDSYCERGTQQMQALVRQSLQYGTLQADYVESFIDNTAYSTVNGSNFSALSDAQSFTARQLPTVLLDSALYGSITEQSANGNTLLTFSEPYALEAWATSGVPTELLSASATALLDEEGTLLEYAYKASYSCDQIVYHLNVTASLMLPQQLDLSAAHPDYSAAPIRVQNLDAPKLLLRAVGDLFTAPAFSSEIDQMLISEVYTLTQTRQSTLHLQGRGSKLTALWNTTLTTVDYRGDPVTTTQSDRFQNGIVTRLVNDAEPLEISQTAEQTRIQWENQVLNGFFALHFIEDAAITDAGDMLILTLTGNEAFCDAVSASFRSVIPNDLNAIADSYETFAAGGTMTIRKSTGLPVDMGMTFQRTHIIDGIAYPLSFSLTQTLKLSDPETFSAIHGTDN